MEKKRPGPEGPDRGGGGDEAVGGGLVWWQQNL